MILDFSEYINESHKLSDDELEVLTSGTISIYCMSELEKPAPDIDYINKMINHGAIINYKILGLSALHQVAFLGWIKNIKLLLDIGADINLLSDSNSTPLHSAVEGGNIDAIRLLLNSGADLSIKNRHNKTPWDYATKSIRDNIPELNPNWRNQKT